MHITTRKWPDFCFFFAFNFNFFLRINYITECATTAIDIFFIRRDLKKWRYLHISSALCEVFCSVGYFFFLFLYGILVGQSPATLKTKDFSRFARHNKTQFNLYFTQISKYTRNMQVFFSHIYLTKIKKTQIFSIFAKICETLHSFSGHNVNRLKYIHILCIYHSQNNVSERPIRIISC